MALMLEVFFASTVSFLLLLGVTALFSKAYRACRKEELKEAENREKNAPETPQGAPEAAERADREETEKPGEAEEK